MSQITSERQKRFVVAYALKANGTEAAMRAGFSPVSAHSTAHDLLKIPEIQAAIAEERARLMADVEFGPKEILKQWVQIATADPAKVVQTRHLNCRHCWGVGHEYQWSAREYAKACDAAAAHVVKGKAAPLPPPSCAGGFGWVFNGPPNPECPECQGEGRLDTRVADMNTLEPAERRLIAGVKVTKDGLEVKFRDQDKARDQAAGYLGMLIDRKELTGKDGAPLHPPADLPAGVEALTQLYHALVK